MKKFILFITLSCFCFEINFSQRGVPYPTFSNLSSANTSASTPRVLIFTKTKGFYHESIPSAVKAIMQLGKENNFLATSTSNAGYFIQDSLKNYAAVIFLSTTGDVLNAGQQAAFERFIQAGGGFAGIHAATDTEYDWPWYNKLVGAYFANHPKPQKATINTVNKNHRSTSFLPANWERFDEWYNFKSVQPDIKILCKLDESTYEGGTMGDNHPFAWYHDFDGGRAFYTAGGHTKESYTEPLFLRHLLGGIEYAIGKNARPVVKITSPLNNAVFYAAANISIKASATDTDGTITNVRFYKGTTLLKTDGISPYSLTWSKVPAGSYSLTAKATDNQGLVTTSAVVKISVLPNKAPVVKITAPVNNTIYTAPAGINITAAASDSDGTIKSVKFYNGSQLLKTDSISPYSYSWSRIPAGSYSITAKASDNRDVTTTSTVIKVSVVTNQPPVVSIVSPANNAAYTAPATIRLVASAKDQYDKVSKVEFYSGSTVLRTERYSPYSYPWTNVQAGSYTIKAKAYDAKGLSAISAPVTVRVTSETIVSRASSVNNKIDPNRGLSLRISPNPTRGTVQLYMKGLQFNERATISVISASGSVVKIIQSQIKLCNWMYHHL